MKLHILKPILVSSLLSLSIGAAVAEELESDSVGNDLGSSLDDDFGNDELQSDEVAQSAELGPEGAFVARKGRVESISGREFVVVADGTTIHVDTSEMEYNPMDNDRAADDVEIGDRVYVRGEIEDVFIEGKKLSANMVVLLEDVSDRDE
ncbi:hypothetical protein [Allohahella marinimesophila]|uniref:DUF5666 domain-containing protein n=1 Tax=Allohahella marinimesophila TaxID=1054972 RepID=A0ABP7Q345_9GAMM